jgi:hypothetical protein
MGILPMSRRAILALFLWVRRPRYTRAGPALAHARDARATRRGRLQRRNVSLHRHDADPYCPDAGPHRRIASIPEPSQAVSPTMHPASRTRHAWTTALRTINVHIQTLGPRPLEKATDMLGINPHDDCGRHIRLAGGMSDAASEHLFDILGTLPPNPRHLPLWANGMRAGATLTSD